MYLNKRSNLKNPKSSTLKGCEPLQSNEIKVAAIKKKLYIKNVLPGKFEEQIEWLEHNSATYWITVCGINIRAIKIYIFGMAVLPFLCRDLSFFPKLSYHRNVSLAVYSLILFFCQKTNLHLYKWSRLKFVYFFP